MGLRPMHERLVAGAILTLTLSFQNCGKSSFEVLPDDAASSSSGAVFSTDTRPVRLESGKLFFMFWDGGPLTAGQVRDQRLAELQLTTNALRLKHPISGCEGQVQLTSSFRSALESAFAEAALDQDTHMRRIEEARATSPDRGYLYLVLSDAGAIHVPGEVPNGHLYYVSDDSPLGRLILDLAQDPPDVTCL